MADSASPIDELLDSLRAALAARRRDGAARIERVEAALAAYRRAIEQQIAQEFAAEHRLKAPAKVGAGVHQAAEQLRDAVLELPELRRLLARADAELAAVESGAPMTLKTPRSSLAPVSTGA